MKLFIDSADIDEIKEVLSYGILDGVTTNPSLIKKASEKHHLNLKDSDLKYKELVKVWKDFKIKGCVQSESPNQEDDALLLQKLWKK